MDKKWILGAMSALMLTGCAHRPAADVEDDVPEGWVLAWEDDFDGETTDTAVWSRIDRGTPDWKNYMSKADTLYDVRDGMLVLRGIEAYEGDNDSVPFLTGGVWTKGKKGFSDGRIEIRAKLQGARGAWPAIWMLPMEAQWPYGGEIDIMERLNSDSIAYQTVHSHYTLNLGQAENPPHGSTGRIDPDGWNDYAVEMSADSLRFLINNVPTFTYPRIETELEGQFPFTSDFYLLIDMQLGGSWVGEVEPADLPVEMLVDRVRFYKRK